MARRVTTKTVFILDLPTGFFFFDPKKEGIVVEWWRGCHEDTNVPRDKAHLIMNKLTSFAKVPVDVSTQRRLQPFPVDEKGVFFGRSKRVIIRPVVVTTMPGVLIGHVPGTSPLVNHPYYPLFPERPVSLHAQQNIAVNTITAA